MRILPWFLGTSCGLPRALPLCAAIGLALSASPAAAQQPKAPASDAPKPAKPPAKKPAAAQPAPAAAEPTPAPAQPPADAGPTPPPGGTPKDPLQPADPTTGAQSPQTPGVTAQPGETPSAPTPGGDKPAPTKAAGGDPLIPPTGAAGAGAVSPNPERDERALEKQGNERPSGTGGVGGPPSEVFAEDWWSHARPTFEFHGYYRLRSELFHNFDLGRKDTPATQLWPQPPDNDHAYFNGSSVTPQDVILCGSNPLALERCDEHTQAGANMRFRLNPELHISDNLRVLSQIDLLDNLVLGSTPEGHANTPSADGGYNVVRRGGYSPTGFFSSTQWAPVSGVNSTSDSISVKRVWGEYLTPLGVLRFGRMPSHWGLGILANGGDGFDSDWQSTSDRIMFVTGFKDLDLYFAGAWDFANEGPISASLNELQGQPYDLGQLDDVSQYVFMAVRRRDPELQKLDLARGDVVLNGGLYFVYRNQFLANDTPEQANSASIGKSPYDIREGYVRRGAEAYIPDLWFQFLYRKFRFEMEASLILGSLENTRTLGGTGSDYTNDDDPTRENDGWKIRQFGIAAEMDYRAVEDRLRLGMGFGYATGDDDVDSLKPPTEDLQAQRVDGERTFSTFRFHPDYRVDMILFRNVLSRVQGAYYFRPSVDYDFTRNKNGQKLGGGAALVWSRASEFVQAPGHKRDLGIELNFQVYYQSKDGALNDDPDKMGGFYTSLQYGVLFPLGGLGYLPLQSNQYGSLTGQTLDTETAQTLRWILGVMF